MTVLGCPIDQLPLTRRGAAWQCPQAHSYDVARDGYVNLLPPGRPSRKSAGDDKDSTAARRRFLNAGYYAPLADRVAELVAALTPLTVVDIGCGEGYYTARLAAPEVVGIDISQPGIRRAARTYPSVTFAVGNALSLPVVSASVDVAVSVFAPVEPDEFARVVRPGGHALIVIPGARHLSALRALLYEEAQPHDEVLPELGGAFESVAHERVDANITLADDAAQRDLLTMTPYRFAVPPAAIARAAAAKPVTTPISFVIALFRARPT